MNSKEALKRIYNDAISMNEIEEDVEEIKKDYELIKQDLDRLEQLEKELKQTKLNFRNSQIHSKNCYKKLKEKYEQLEKDYDELFDYHALLTIKLEQLEKERQEIETRLSSNKETNTFDEIATMIKKANDYDVLVNKCKQLEKENKELKERYKKRAELCNEFCEYVKKYEKALDILKDKMVNIPKLLTTTLIVYNNLALLLGYDKLTQEEYELLKNVMEE